MDFKEIGCMDLRRKQVNQKRDRCLSNIISNAHVLILFSMPFLFVSLRTAGNTENLRLAEVSAEMNISLAQAIHLTCMLHCENW